MNPLVSTPVVVAVSGGIAAYKAADLVSSLVQAGAVVDVIMTRGAREFVRPLTFQALTHRTVHEDLFAPWSEASLGHVSLARDAALLIVAPASANTITRLALGMADDLLGAVALSTRAPILLAPAMEHHMVHHPATRGNLDTLVARGATLVGPASGRLASGETGDGRLAAIPDIIAAARWLLGRAGPMAGRHVVVTAGGTREPIDPVRYLTNGSSGLMGYAIARAAIDAGATVCLISAPVALPPVPGAEMVRVETAQEMAAAVGEQTGWADVLIMAAAVSDFRPASVAGEKVKKRGDGSGLSLDLVPNPDILASLDRPGLLKVGFAAETEDLIANARSKLVAKGLAMIVANDARVAIGRPDNEVVFLTPGTDPEPLPRMAKDDLAAILIARIAGLLDRDRA